VPVQGCALPCLYLGKAFTRSQLAVLWNQTFRATEEPTVFCDADFVSDIGLSLVTRNHCATFSCQAYLGSLSEQICSEYGRFKAQWLLYFPPSVPLKITLYSSHSLYTEWNPVITTPAYTAPRLYRHILCGTN